MVVSCQRILITRMTGGARFSVSRYITYLFIYLYILLYSRYVFPGPQTSPEMSSVSVRKQRSRDLFIDLRSSRYSYHIYGMSSLGL